MVAATVVVAIGDALGDAWCGRAVLWCAWYFGQDGAQMPLARDQHTVQ